VSGPAAPGARPIVVAGEALIDLVPAADGLLAAHEGGGPFNAARTIARLNRPVSFLGRLSTDAFGRRLEQSLADDGVGTSTVVHTSDPTTLALADLDHAGAASYGFYAQATAAPGLTPEAALAALPPATEVIYTGSLGLALEPIALALEALIQLLARRALVVVDPNFRPGAAANELRYRTRLADVFELADVVKLSEHDLALLNPRAEPRVAARALLEAGPAVVLLTRGAAGAVVITPTGKTEVPAPQVQIADTIGAGDAFGGAFVAWWTAQGLGVRDLRDHEAVVSATTFACLVAAKTCERKGASPPFASELPEPLAGVGG
jgi:fructokinase